MRRRVLFVSHAASRSGAPRVLLALLSWLSRNTDIEPSIMLQSGGELADEFARLGPVVTLAGQPAGARPPLRVVRRLGFAEQPVGQLPDELSSLERTVRHFARRIALRELRGRIKTLGEPDLAYLNSVNSAAALPFLPADARVITHVHELGYHLRELKRTEPQTLRQMLARTDRYVAASGAVADALVDELDIERARIDLCYEFISTDHLRPGSVAASAARDELRLPPNALVVGSVGTIEWRKGPDLFIQVAKRTYEILGNGQTIVFLWVGPAATWGDRWGDQVQHDLEHAGLSGRVQFVGARADPALVMSLFDVFILTSRSDAFPLVCLEAGALGKPIVSFEAGGTSEFLPADGRLVVPYLDVDAMAKRVAQLLLSEVERHSIGDGLATRVREHYRVDTVAPQILACIDRLTHRGVP